MFKTIARMFAKPAQPQMTLEQRLIQSTQTMLDQARRG